MRTPTLLWTLGLAGALLAGTASAATTTAVVMASGDTSMTRGSPNQNRGADTELELRSTGHERVLVKMDNAALRDAVGSGRLVAARLELDIVSSDQNLGSGTPVSVNALARAWNEGDGMRSGATWSCANDTNLANNKIDCADADRWDMETGVATWAPASATVSLVANQTGTVGWDVTADVTAQLAGTAGHGWTVMKADRGANGRISFAARERGAQGPRLVLTIEPAAANTWKDWSGVAGQTFDFPAGEREHDTLMLGTDRVLWVGARVDTDWSENFGHLRLLALDRDTHTLTVLAETSLTALLPEFMSGLYYSWEYDSNLIRLADGGVVLVFHNNNASALAFVTLDVDDAGIRVRGTPVLLDQAAFIEPGDESISFDRSSIAKLADGRFLVSYTAHPPQLSDYQGLNLWEEQPLGLSLSGNATRTSGEVTLTEDGSNSGRLVWEFDVTEGKAVELWINGTPASKEFPLVLDREPGFEVVAPLSAQPKTWLDIDYVDQTFRFLAPYTGKAYLKLRAPTAPGASVTLRSASLAAEDAPQLRLRFVSLTNGVATLGSAINVPGDGAAGKYLRIQNTHLEALDPGRMLLHVNTRDPLVGFTHASVRVLTLADTGLTMGDWTEIVPSSMGPDYPYPRATNTDTRAEGMIASVAWDAMNDEPLIGPFGISGDRITSTGAQLLESTEGYYRNGLSYLGNNEYLLAQEMRTGYDAESGVYAYKQHFYVLRTDGQGKLVGQSGPFEAEGALSSPRIEVLDDDHLLVLWHKWYSEYSEEQGWTNYARLSGKILFKH